MPERRRVAINLSNDLEFRRNDFFVRQNMCSNAFLIAAFRNLMSEMRRCGESFAQMVATRDDGSMSQRRLVCKTRRLRRAHDIR
jgi:hypothetical protein